MNTSISGLAGGAVSVTGARYALARRLPRPTFDAAFHLPTNTRIDRPLVTGAALFGIGWGLSGFCPGPAVAALSTGARPVLVFVAAMLLGMAAHHGLTARTGGLARPGAN